MAIKNSSGKYIFITDADCHVNRTWVQEGLNCLETDCLGVEGSVVYVAEDFQPTFSTVFMENYTGGHYMAGSVAYRKDVLENIGGFNEKINYFTDRDVGLKVKRLGPVCFNRNMVATHPLFMQTPSGLLKSARRIETRVYLFKMFGDKVFAKGRIVNPFNLATIFFPGAIFVRFSKGKFERKEDYELLPFTYFYAILERIHLWKACVKNRVFFI